MNGRPNSPGSDFWIIGFGNRHRRDDGIGPYVTDRLRRRFGKVDGVRLLSLHQLGPELAEDLGSAGRVFFIDAAFGPQPGKCSWRRARPLTELQEMAHRLSAGALLGLTELLYKRSPPAWMVSVQGSDFDFGEGLSMAAQSGARRAMRAIARIIHRRFHLTRRIPV